MSVSTPAALPGTSAHEHEEILITHQEVSDNLESTVACFDDLFADWGTISTRLLYGKCREQGMKVVLVGEGADELFGGYDVFRSSASRAPADWWLFQLYRSYCGRRYGRYFGAFRALMRELSEHPSTVTVSTQFDCSKRAISCRTIM